MKFKKSDYFIFCTLSIVLIFVISFNVAVRLLNESKNSPVEKVDILTNTNRVEKVLPMDTKIVLKLKNKDSEISKLDVKMEELKNFIPGDITLSKVKEYYQKDKFQFLEENNNEVIFIKETIYIPGRYYLGFTDKEFAAVFKCNHYGNLFIEKPEEDISNRCLETLPENAQKNLQEFKYEYENKEEALDELMAICS